MDKRKELALARQQLPEDDTALPEPKIPQPTKTSNKGKSGKIIGRCLTMCPPEEVKEREEHHSLNTFEFDPKSYVPQSRGVNKAKAEWAVKQFVRSAADRKMDDEQNIRPPEVLARTLNYIISNIADADVNNKKGYVTPLNGNWLTEIYTFISDRTRAIRPVSYTHLTLPTNREV
eukprot:TRINITY_DN4765_c0_g3_i1.p2 TRINITY_DN4765_c0_g3~~TRINITY_DN4765_c0_g3_i1.p2  ORF type:complete len:175 (-),score=50.17 TRINITY_DN4765_c0_g3_i1:47-571(-)